MSGDPRPFRLRAEWPWVLLAAALSIVVRLPFLSYALPFFNADAAVACLMSRHLWTGEGWPTVFYGQDYPGGFEAWLAAPFYGLLGADPRGFMLAEIGLTAVIVAVLYRLAYAVGGRGGALAGTLPMAVGGMVFYKHLAGFGMSYLTLILLGALLLAAGRALILRPTPARAARVGLILGLGWWNNPQIATFVAPLGLVWYLHGTTCARLRARRLGRSLGRWRWLLRAALLGLGLAVVATVALALGGWERLPVGRYVISVSRPERYLVRLVMLAGLLAVGLEAVLQAAPRRWLTLGGAFALAAALGLSPQIAHKLQRGDLPVKRTPSGLDPSKIVENVPRVLDFTDYVLFNHGPSGLIAPGAASRWGYTGLRVASQLLIAALVLGTLWLRRRGLARLARLRPLAPSWGLLIGLQWLALLGLVLLFPHGVYDRYFMVLWVGLPLLLSGGHVWLWARVGRWAALVPGVLVTYLLVAAAANVSWLAAQPPVGPPTRHIEALRSRGVTHGHANYWSGYVYTYLADERIQLASHPWGLDFTYYPPYRARSAEAARLVFVIGHSTHGTEAEAHRRFMASMADWVVERWFFEGDTFYLVQRGGLPSLAGDED